MTESAGRAFGDKRAMPMPVEISEFGDRLIAKFAFHPGAVEKIKALPGATYSGEHRSWSVSKRYAKRLHQTVYEIDALLAADAAAVEEENARIAAEIKSWVQPSNMMVKVKDREFSLEFKYDDDHIAALKEMVPARRWAGWAFKIPASSETQLRDFLHDRAMKIARDTLACMSFTMIPFDCDDRRELLERRLKGRITNIDKLAYGPAAPTS
jgi:hypothetical protein